jgi:hypothetical protein
MRIFYTASYFGKDQFQNEYDLVLQCLRKQPIVIVGTEVGNYLNFLPSKISSKIKDPKKLHYEAIKYGILNSEAVIIETSFQDFQLGHEATLAILSKKHVLCLSTLEDYSEKIKNEYFHGAKYNKYNLDEIISDFIKLVQEEKLNNRFNMFLSDRQIKFLQKASGNEKLNMSEYIRKLIEEDMQIKA